MNIKSVIAIVFSVTMMLLSCSDSDSFSMSPALHLTFSEDSISLDTVFSTVPTATRSFWVYNHSKDGIRCTTIRLQRGNQTGFRVNVDGTYLGQSVGYQTQNVEIRAGDSIRVFVELTSPNNYSLNPKLIEDNLIFSLENGNEQKVNLNAYSWDAKILNNVTIEKDSTLHDVRPIIVYGGIRVGENATLTIPEGTSIYFHHDAGIDVYGRLITQGTPEREVMLRGDRIDRMFDYLPYDNISGQWKGIRFHQTSFSSTMTYTDLHGANDGIVCDSSATDRPKLTMDACTVHNCQGYGIAARYVQMALSNCQISNTLNDCLSIEDGVTLLNNCTIAQFYPFNSKRGTALSVSIRALFKSLQCRNTLITGYDDNVLRMAVTDTTVQHLYQFDDCMIRTPKVTTKDSIHYNRVIFENVTDTTMYGYHQFVKIDTDNLRYDFRLKDKSAAIGKANPSTTMPTDRNGLKRDDLPDIGSYEAERTK